MSWYQIFHQKQSRTDPVDSFFRWTPGLPGSLSLGGGLEAYWGYVFALVAVLIALALTMLSPGSQRDPIFVYFLLAILGTQFVAGVRPALLVAALSCVFLIDLAFPSAHSAGWLVHGEGARLFNFFLLVLVVMALNTRRLILAWQARVWRRKALGLPSIRTDMSLFEWDVETGQMVWSERLWALRDLKPGDSYQNRVPENDRGQVLAALKEAAERGTVFDVHYRVTGSDGDCRCLAVTGQFLKGRHRARWAMGTITDETVLLRINEQLRSNERHFELAQETTLMATWEWPIGNNRIQWSPGSGRVYGRPGDGFDLTVEQFYEGVDPLDRPRLKKLLAKAFRDKSEYEIEFRYQWPDGSQHWLFTRARALEDEKGAMVRLIGVTLEITARKQAEEALRVTDKLAANGRLAATLAHEINNPLHSLRSLLYLMEQQSPLSPALGRYIEMGQREIVHAAEIVRQTLGLYRQPGGALSAQPRQEVEQVLSMCQRRAQRDRIEIDARLDFDGTVPVLPGEIRQIATNLVLNAVDAGCRHLRIHLYQTHGPGENGQRYVRLVIADDGPGMPRNVASRLFEPFFTTKGERGTGLGLWVIRGIANKYGGSIRLRSRTDSRYRGTTFMVCLPAEPWSGTPVSSLAAPDFSQLRSAVEHGSFSDLPSVAGWREEQSLSH